jgi:hypothetical protein
VISSHMSDSDEMKPSSMVGSRGESCTRTNTWHVGRLTSEKEITVTITMNAFCSMMVY